MCNNLVETFNLILMNKIFRIICSSFVFISIFSSCGKESSTIKDNQKNYSSSEKSVWIYAEGDIILGHQLNNPYSLANMQLAYNNLTSNNIVSKYTPNIRPTHYYIKFKPNNFEQLEILSSDSTLILYDYPLDYLITQSGNRYHDPGLPDSVPTYQYSVVTVNYVFNNSIPYEILSTLYLPEEDKSLIGQNNDNNNFIVNLVNQAYLQTNNQDDTISINTNASSYTPGGTILINDTRLNADIGLEGVEVRARRWFTTYIAHTNFAGTYLMSGSFNGPCNYSLHFEQNHFRVKEQVFQQTAWIDGPKKTGNWDYTISSGYDRFIGHIFRGAYRYHYNFIDGLQRPYRPSGLKTNYIGKNTANNAGINYIVFPILAIGRYDNNNNEYASDEVFSATIHETAHTSHVILMNSGAIQYAQVTSQIQESWAIGVEWWLTKLEYKITRSVANYGDWNYSVVVIYPHRFGYQYWSQSTSNKYTSLFIDLIDDHNELGQSYGSQVGTVDDQVNHFTLANIESLVLKHSYGLTSLKTNLKANKPASVTDAQIDLLITYY